MKLIDNAKAALTKGYVARIIYLGGLAELALRFIIGVDGIPREIIYCLLVLILVARVIKQDSVSGKKEEADDDAPLGI